MLETIPALPFSLNFMAPVVKVICGDLFAGLLTAQGQVFTWGGNQFGQLGLKDEKLGIALDPMRVEFEKKNERIIDIACGQNHCLALNDSHQVYGWGKRMGMYPPIELSLSGIEGSQMHLLQEYNQAYPRHLKSNLIFYKLAGLRAGGNNSALITQSGEILIEGMNHSGQLGVG